MTADEQRVLALRMQRQREFEPIQRRLLRLDLPTDHSALGARRRGWSAPVRTLHRGATPAGVSTINNTPPDTVRLAFIRIDFLHDRGGSASTGDGKFDLSPPDTNAVPIDRPPHNRDFYRAHGEALRRFYDVQSYGHEVIEVDVWPAEQDSAYHLSDMADLGPWAFGSSDAVYRAAVSMMRKMFFAADTQSAMYGRTRIPWDTYDRYMFIHAGSDLQSDVKQDSKEDIPSFTVFLGDTDRIVFPDSTQFRRDNPIDRASFVPETINQDGYYGALNGVIAHENGHNMFGFLDVYNIETGYPVCGTWTLMDSGNLLGSRVLLKDGTQIYAIGMLPSSIDPLQRSWQFSSGMDIREPVWGDTLTLADNERHNVFYKVPLSSDEYLLLENRYLSPADTLLQLDSDSTTKVVLGPKQPDRFEVDALQPGGGILVWHVDESVIPFATSLRVNPDYGLNTNFAREGLQIDEADGLDDLGDPGSPFILGSPLDPYQRDINPVLSDTTQPNLLPNTFTHPHLRLDFLDDADSTMHFTARRSWGLPGFPVKASFPPGGPVLMAIDADGDRNLEVCWAGGSDSVGTDSAAVFAVRADGSGLGGGRLQFATLDRRPRSQMAAVATGDPVLGTGPSLFALTTYTYGAADTVGGRVWLIGADGQSQPGWPVRLPAHASTPPVIAGVWPSVTIFVGAEDGNVYALDSGGHVVATSTAVLGGGVRGMLAVWSVVPGSPFGPTARTSARAGASPTAFVAAGGGSGQVEELAYNGPGGLDPLPGWPLQLGGSGFVPDFLWLRLGGVGTNAIQDCLSYPSLVVHHADRLWAFCPDGSLLRGWGQSLGDTIVAGLGAGDPDGDGLPEVLVQTVTSKVAFINRDGHPSPGWPRASTTEALRTLSPALALDVDGDQRAEIVTLNGSGLLAALRADGRTPEGWPLASGAGAAGAMLAADLNRDGTLEVIAPDRDTLLWGYSVPVLANQAVASSWTMFGGDPGRTFALPDARTPTAPAASAGPVVAGSVKAFPNPARRKPVSFAYTLTEDASVEYRILDVSGHEVASFTRPGSRAENLETWDPGALPAGLYMARLEFRGAHGSRTFVLPVGLLR
jgi:M6 family metalloprotease-like protein